MLLASSRIEDLTIEYTQCEVSAPTGVFGEIPAEYYTFNFNTPSTVKPQWMYTVDPNESDPAEAGQCHVQFEIPQNIKPPIYYFYRLKDFYANHRRFVKSFSEDQLNGKDASENTIKNTIGQNCQPLSTDENGTKIYPCGLIANSLFNDTFTPLQAVNGSGTDYLMTNKGISWSKDKDRFKKTVYNASQIVPPPNWVKRFPQGYNDTNIPDISEWPEFQNWMHPAGLPDFSKIILRNDGDVLQKGVYETVVGLHWPVRGFSGHKYIYISTRSVIGGRNPFLGISWVVVGGLCLVLSLAFMIVSLLKPRKVGDSSLLSWNKEKVN
ncbi:hypothetical protein BABINDRAFT_47086 [Babjeviella inositovora NRRL Y-12698]|uniref:Uncharacterized protein n=1 Tax=Babjeviella inositovora NRRL Y-12698 TaxID=984486 RepID=A0A1E3QW77_9ASCO|nr:uncharacterized protein BABINDRAFT_47086 [Babjeviella inositovora NRRL Y-12698]ODQ81237.1 hypothetical protein BABINDRAFT_47086 [Babjeviella inositovora NRRL Y-12698]